MKNKIFIFKVFLFSLPFIAVAFPFIAFCFFVGESFSFSNSFCSNDDYLVGYAYNQGYNKNLKFEHVSNCEKKKVWALGSSRVLQFRKQMFDSSFYNAGFTISSINDFLPFMNAIDKEKYPDVLIICIDQWMLNENWDDLKVTQDKTFWSQTKSVYTNKGVFTAFYKDIFGKKYSLIKMLKSKWNNPNLQGLNALKNGKGIRNDGSMNYGNQIEKLLSNNSKVKDYKFENTFHRIQKGISRFEYSDTINVNALNSLTQFLKFCHDNDIYVIGFLPPYAQSVYNKMIESGNYEYLNQIYDSCLISFDKYHYELWDFSSPNMFNSNDDEFIDGFHGAESCYAKMLIHMMKNDSKIQEHSSISKLENDLENKVNRLNIYLN